MIVRIRKLCRGDGHGGRAGCRVIAEDAVHVGVNVPLSAGGQLDELIVLSAHEACEGELAVRVALDRVGAAAQISRGNELPVVVLILDEEADRCAGPGILVGGITELEGLDKDFLCGVADSGRVVDGQRGGSVGSNCGRPADGQSRLLICAVLVVQCLFVVVLRVVQRLCDRVGNGRAVAVEHGQSREGGQAEVRGRAAFGYITGGDGVPGLLLAVNRGGHGDREAVLRLAVEVLEHPHAAGVLHVLYVEGADVYFVDRVVGDAALEERHTEGRIPDIGVRVAWIGVQVLIIIIIVALNIGIKVSRGDGGRDFREVEVLSRGQEHAGRFARRGDGVLVRRARVRLERSGGRVLGIDLELDVGERGAGIQAVFLDDDDVGILAVVDRRGRALVCIAASIGLRGIAHVDQAVVRTVDRDIGRGVARLDRVCARVG